MSFQSTLDAGLIRAYRETHYKVHYQVSTDPTFILLVDQASDALASAHEHFGVACSAFITAFNPFSKALSAAENTARQASLADDLKRRNLPLLAGIGQHPTGDWPGEPSYLILGVPLAEARALGEAFEQNAIIWSGADAVPRLELLR